MSPGTNANIGLMVHFILVAIGFLLILAMVPSVRESITEIIILL